MRKIKEIYLNIIFTAGIVITIFFLGLAISFMFIDLMPGDPVAAWLASAGIHNPSQAQYDQARRLLGFDLPISLRFLKYLGDHLTGNWSVSISIASQQPVLLMISLRFPTTIQATILPMIFGISLGIILGIIASRYRNKWEDTVIQGFGFLFVAIPVFFLGTLFQFSIGYVLDIFNPTGITFMPLLILTLAITSVIALQIRSFLIKPSDERSVITITSLVARTFGYLFMLYVLIEVLFGINGICRLIIYAIFLYDYFVLVNLLFLIMIIFIITIVVSNLLFLLYRFLATKGYTERIARFSNPKPDIVNEGVRFEKTIKDYLLIRATSPIFIVGFALVITFIVFTIFPNLLTSYSYYYLQSPQPGSWNPPSPGHPLGQTVLGWDVLGRMMFGIRESVVTGVGAAIIGLIGGVNFGFVAGKFKPWGYKPIMIFMIFFYIIPGFLFIILLMSILGPLYIISFLTIGILLIPLFTRATTNAMTGEFSRKTIGEIGKSLITYFPLAIALAILLSNIVGFLGFADYRIIQLGHDINYARQNPYIAPWGWTWPGLAITLILISFLMLHLGLKGHGSILRALRKSKNPEFKVE